MRLVMIQEYGDYEGNWENHYPIIHESPEAAFVEWEEKAQEVFKKGGLLQFCGTEWNPYYFGSDYGNFDYIPPRFLTVDEWFEGKE